MAWCWHHSVDKTQRRELAETAAAEWGMWQGLLGLVNAADNEEELARVRAYFKATDDSYSYTVRRSPAVLEKAEGSECLRVTEITSS